MLDLNRIFSHRPEAAATISSAPGYERLQGQVLFYPASGGTVVVAQLQGLPGDGFFGLHLHQVSPGAALAARSGNHLMAQATTGVSQVSGIPGIWGIFPFCCLRMGGPGAPFGPVGFSPVRPGVTPSSSTVWQTTTAPNRQGTPERGSVVASSGSYFSLSRRCR